MIIEEYYMEDKDVWEQVLSENRLNKALEFHKNSKTLVDFGALDEHWTKQYEEDYMGGGSNPPETSAVSSLPPKNTTFQKP